MEMYHIAGNFRGRKPLGIGEKYNFRGENFHELLACCAERHQSPSCKLLVSSAHYYKVLLKN